MEPSIERVVTVEKVLYKAVVWPRNIEITAATEQELVDFVYKHDLDLDHAIERVVVSSEREVVTASATAPAFSGDANWLNSEIQAAYGYDFKSQSKISAIKRYRELTGKGLKESKDAVDSMIDHGDIY